MSTHNICFHREIRKISTLFSQKKKKWLIWSYAWDVRWETLLTLMWDQRKLRSLAQSDQWFTGCSLNSQVSQLLQIDSEDWSPPTDIDLSYLYLFMWLRTKSCLFTSSKEFFVFNLLSRCDIGIWVFCPSFHL